LILEKQNKKKQLENQIKVFAQHQPNPVSNIKELNKTLKDNLGVRVRRKTVVRLLDF
jgi:hypothetical protein